ncbi:hypothetical protein COP2_044459 [Malus domestica]
MLELHRYGTALLHVFALIRVFSKVDVAILYEDCNGRRWLLCDFCKGQKTNVKSETNRIYGRCPSCRTVSFELFLTRESPITLCFRSYVRIMKDLRELYLEVEVKVDPVVSFCL